MRLSWFFKQARREMRGTRRRSLFFAACLTAGVAAVVAVAGLSDGFDRTLRENARELLAADVAVKGGRPIPPQIADVLRGIPGARRTDVREMATMVGVPDGSGGISKSLLADLKVVEGDYPFYGALQLEPMRPLAELLGAEGVVAAPELPVQLGVRVGERLRIGGAEYVLRGIVLSEPDRVEIGFSIGPRVFLDARGLARADLERAGSRIEHRALIRLPGRASTEEVERVSKALSAALPDPAYYSVETYRDAQPALRNALRRAERFLGLVALVSLLAGGIGVAQTVRAWIASRLDGIAVLRCLGLRPREALGLYAGQSVALALLSSLIGILVGLALQLAVSWLVPGLETGATLRLWQPQAMLRGLLLGVGVALAFSVPPLTVVRRVPPLRVFRRQAEPLPSSRVVRLLTAATLAAFAFAAAWAQSGSPLPALVFTAGLLAAALVLAGAGWLLARAAGGVPRRRAAIWLRHGLAALARPGAGTLGAVVALGLGVLVVLALYLVERRLSEQLSAELPSSAPNAFLVDIQPDQWAPLQGLLREAGVDEVTSAPVVMARFASIDGKRVEDMAGTGPDEHRRRWALTREQRLTYRADLPAGNTLLAGRLFEDPTKAEVSIEEEFARDLGVGVGSTLVIDVQGVPVELAVTSLRRVDWRTFGINFFLLVEPGVLEKAPQLRVATVKLRSDAEQVLQNRLVETFPNVTVIRIRQILERVVALLSRIGLIVRFVGLFTVVAGAAILAGSVSASAALRGREVALLKTLGMTRGGVVGLFAFEHALVGAVAGLVGTAGGSALAWGVLHFGLDIRWAWEPAALAVSFASTVALAVAAGLLASAGALRRRPLEVLRQEVD